jgi:sulfate permease, SulP family
VGRWRRRARPSIGRGHHAGLAVGPDAGGDGVLRLGFLANFLSHPVISGFITASGMLIAASQLKHILGIRPTGDTLLEICWALLGESRRRPTCSRWRSASAAPPSCSGCARAEAAACCGARAWRRALADLSPRPGRWSPSRPRRCGLGARTWPGRGVKIVGDGAAGPAALHAAVLRPVAVAAAAGAGAADLLIGLSSRVGRADAGRQAAPADRARPGAGRAGRANIAAAFTGRLSGDGRLRAVGGQLRRRGRDARPPAPSPRSGWRWPRCS